MHLFTRRGRKESSQGSSGSPSRSSGSKIMSASLPATTRRNSSTLPALPDKGSQPRRQHAQTTSPAIYIEDGNSSNSNHGHSQMNEFGQLPTYTAPPAFLVDARSNGSQSYFKPLPDAGARKVMRRMSTGSVPSIDGFLKDAASGDAELQLCYGYWPIETQRELNLVQIEEIVRLCGQEIKARGIEAPLLFSTQALDITLDGICSLIRSYLTTRDLWKRDLQFANPHDLSGMIKWALGRYINPQGGRGILAWEMFERWRFGEREKEFPPRYITTHLFYLLPTQNAGLLTTLLGLMSSAVTYTTKNGCTTRKLSTLFSSYIFGLPDDGTFEHTYTAFNRFSHATEHLLLAYIREQTMQHTASGSPTPVPIRLQELVKNYPQMLPTNLNKPPNGAQLQQVIRIRRHVRFYSKNLVQSAGTWEVPRSANWASIAPFPNYDAATKPPAFQYTSRYRHLLNIGSTLPEASEDDGMQKFSSVVQKEWSTFMQGGFAASDQSKLKFDLTESERMNRRRKHETIDWSTFANSGFVGRETFLDTDLNFDPTANDLVKGDDLLSEDHRKLMAAKARSIEKALPPFHYDITPREERPIQIDRQFFEVFSDVLCSSGWMRDEMKESNWALIQYRTRPKTMEEAPAAGDCGRKEDTWFLIEELVPSEYRASLLEAGQIKPKSSRKISFLRSVRKKSSKVPPLPTISSPPRGVGSEDYNGLGRTGLPYPPSRSTTGGSSGSRSPSPALRQPHESLFAPGPGGPPTKVVSLSKNFPSAGMSSTSIAEEEHETLDDTSAAATGRTSLADGVERSMSSQKGGGIGFTKPKNSSNGPGSALMGLMRRTTGRGKDANIPVLNTAVNRSKAEMDSPASFRSPNASGSPGFNLEEHGVDGSGQPIENPKAWMDAMNRQQEPPEMNTQRYQRAPPSFSGTTRTMDTKGTSGHSETGGGSTIRGSPGMGSPNEEDSPSSQSRIRQRGASHASTASPSPARPRPSEDSEFNLPQPSAPRPSQEFSATEMHPGDALSAPQPPSKRITTASAMAAQEIVDSYRRSDEDPNRASVAPSENPYDGMAGEDDHSTSQGHETLVVPDHVRHGTDPESPAGESVWRGSAYQAPPPPPPRKSSLSEGTMPRSDSGVGLLSPDRPKMFYKGHPSQEVVPTVSPVKVSSPTTAMSPVSSAPTPPLKSPNIAPTPSLKSPPPRSEVLAQEIEARRRAINTPVVPVNGTGKVCQLAGRFGGTSSR